MDNGAYVLELVIDEQARLKTMWWLVMVVLPIFLCTCYTNNRLIRLKADMSEEQFEEELRRATPSARFAYKACTCGPVVWVGLVLLPYCIVLLCSVLTRMLLFI